MMMSARFGFLSFALLSAACATQNLRSVPNESLAMIVWAKPASGCDFENPDRDTAIAISTTIHTSLQTLPAKKRTYFVKDAQMLAAPNVGETLCASLVRYQRISVNLAVYGLEIDSISQGKLRLRPAYVRVDDKQSEPVQVSLGVSAAHIVAGHPVSPQIARLDFGTVIRSKPETVLSESRVIDGPTSDNMFRLAAIVVEDSASVNEAEVISEADLIRLLSETN